MYLSISCVYLSVSAVFFSIVCVFVFVICICMYLYLSVSIFMYLSGRRQIHTDTAWAPAVANFNLKQLELCSRWARWSHALTAWPSSAATELALSARHAGDPARENQY
jgi:hypothetical protein